MNDRSTAEEPMFLSEYVFTIVGLFFFVDNYAAKL